LPITKEELLTEIIMTIEERLEASLTQLEQETLRRMFTAVILREEEYVA
jgi:hypothetical protein